MSTLSPSASAIPQPGPSTKIRALAWPLALTAALVTIALWSTRFMFPWVSADQILIRQKGIVPVFGITILVTTVLGSALSRSSHARFFSKVDPRWVLQALALACYFIGVRFYAPYTNDDTMIFARYAQNLADGHGLVFNVGEHVEGFTSFAWVIVLGVAAKATLGVLLAAKALGIALGALCIVLLFQSVENISNAAAAFLAAMILAVNQHFLSWVASGMDVAIFMAWQMALMRELTRPQPHASRWFGVLSVVGPWIRPEAYLLVPLAWAWLATMSLSRTLRLRRALVATALSILILFGFRWLYFHRLFPNTYFAKAFLAPQALAWGRTLIEYLSWPLVAVAVAGLVMLARRAGWAIVFALALSAHLYRCGGDILALRFGLWLLPLLLLGIGRVLGTLSADHTGLGRAAGAALVLLLASGEWIRMNDAVSTQWRTCYESGHLYVASNSTATFEADYPAAMAVRAQGRPEDLLATDNIGATGYFGRTRIFDTYGLIDRDVADLLAKGRGTEILALLESRSPRWVIATETGGRHTLFSADVDAWLAMNYRIVGRWNSRTRWSRVLFERVR